MNSYWKSRSAVALMGGSILAGVAVAVFVHQLESTRVSLLVPVVETMEPLHPSPPLPTSIPKETFSQISPDGKKTLGMTVTTNSDSTKTYVVMVQEPEKEDRLLYTSLLPQPEHLSIPFNTWSPDDIHVFLTHTTTTGTEAIVMRADGKPYPSGEQALNITTLFTEKNTGNTYLETTGWASETLLIVNTTALSGTRGPSYWFEVPSKAILRLSTQF